MGRLKDIIMRAKRSVERANPYWKIVNFSLGQYAGRRLQIICLIGTSFLLTCSELFIPVFVGRLVDTLSKGASHFQDTYSLLAMIVILGIISVFLRDIIFRVIIYFTSGIMRLLTVNIFSHIQRLSTEWHIHNLAGATLRKLSRGVQAMDLFNYLIFIELIPSAFILIGATLMIGWHWPMAGVIVGTSLLVFVCITLSLIQKYIYPAAKVANDADAVLNGTISDAISCNMLVKSFASESKEEARVRSEAAAWRSHLVRFWHRSCTAGSIQYVMLVALNGVLIGTGLWLWQRGYASPGDVIYIITTYAIINGYLRGMENNIRSLQRSVNEMEDLVTFNKVPVEAGRDETVTTKSINGGSIVFKNIDFRYPGQDKLLYKNFNLSIAAGERIGVVGHSGGGKTTFVKLLQRLYEIERGNISIDGINIKDVNIECLRNHISIVSQEPLLFHRSLLENISYGNENVFLADIHDAAKRARIHDFIMSLPDGYDTVVGERGLRLSGGEKQRVAIARIMLRQTPIIVLDEATSNLDSISEAEIQSEIESSWSNRTLIVIAHRLSSVRDLDRILVFADGQIVEEGDHETLLLKKDGNYKALMEKQNRYYQAT
ncbi:ABC transporter ATP-binding protein [Sodalis sp. RH16]|uniref:ABC transporter ATP-binding protein n=1 Tax=Sodalis sp. RH16 TaxID=3394331 RepID=UPI0039B37ADA